MERTARHARSSLGLVAIVLVLASGCSNSSGARKNRSFMELEFQLKSADGVPLANFPMAVGSFYDQNYETSSTTDGDGRFYRTYSKDRDSLPLIEPFVEPDAFIDRYRMSIFLPLASRYGDYQVLFAAPRPADAPNFDGRADRPREVPTKIEVAENADRDTPSTFVHGAYYHPTTGGLETTTIIGNGEQRLVPVTPRGSRAFLRKIAVSEHPRLQISSKATALVDRPGWRFEVLLVLEPFEEQSAAVSLDPPSTPAKNDAPERIVLKRDQEVRAGDLTLTLAVQRLAVLAAREGLPPGSTGVDEVLRAAREL